MARLRELIGNLRSLVEAYPVDQERALPQENAKDPTPIQDTPRRSECPPGFKFDGKRCISMGLKGKKKSSDKDDKQQSGPPESDRPEIQGDLPFTRFQPNVDKEVPTIPDPDSEVMQQLHNKYVYVTGQKPYEYADNEWPEYAHSSFTQAKFPDAFQDKDEWVKAFLHGEHDETTDWSQFINGDAKNQEKGNKESLSATLWDHLSANFLNQGEGDDEAGRQEFDKYIDSLIDQADKEAPETTPPVIVGVHTEPRTGKETYYLLSGNTRSLLYSFLGKPCPVRVVPLKGRLLPDPSADEMNNDLWPAEQSSEDPEEKEQNVRTAVQALLKKRTAGDQPPAPPPGAPAPAAPPVAPPAAGAPPAAEAVETLRKVFTF